MPAQLTDETGTVVNVFAISQRCVNPGRKVNMVTNHRKAVTRVARSPYTLSMLMLNVMRCCSNALRLIMTDFHVLNKQLFAAIGLDLDSGGMAQMKGKLDTGADGNIPPLREDVSRPVWEKWSTYDQ